LTGAGHPTISVTPGSRHPDPPTGSRPAGSRPGQPTGAPRRVIRRQNGLPGAIAARLPEVLADPPRRAGAGSQGPPRVRIPKRPRPPAAGPGRLGGAETTTGTAQAAVLALGGLLLAGAVFVLAVTGYGTVSPLGRVALLTFATAILLLLPVLLARRGLTATAETVASVGLLMVLLDGYVTWSLDLFNARSFPTQVYFGLICVATALIATAYRGASHLVAPRYATVLVLQPVPPLLGYELIHSNVGWALALAAVAVLDLALAVSLTRPGRFAKLAGFVRPVHLPSVHLPSVHLPTLHRPEPEPAETAPPGPPRRPESAPEEPDEVVVAAGEIEAPPRRPEPEQLPPQRPEGTIADELAAVPPTLQAPAFLRELTWVLFTLAFGAAFAYAASALATATALPPTMRAALVLLLTAAVGVVGALAWRREPMPDVAGGLATLALIAAITRVGTAIMPSETLLFVALAVAIAAAVVPVLPETARRGPGLASSAAAAGAGLYLLIKAVPAIAAPIDAARPWWRANLGGYTDQLAAAAGPAGWQLVIAGALLTFAVAVSVPGSVRTQAVLAGGVLTLLTAPAAMHLNWLLTPGVLALAAIAIGAIGLRASDEASANGFVSAAAVVGGYAALTSLSHPAVTSLTLAALTLGGFVIAMLRPMRSDPESELAGRRIGDWAAGGAAFALPGAVSSGLTALVREAVLPGADSSVVLAGGFLAVSGTLAYAAITLVAGRRRSTPLLTGTTLGALVVALSALVAPRTTIIDMAVGLLLLTSAILLWLAPSLGGRVVFGIRLDGNDVAAAAVTASVTAALARVLALAVPGVGLVTTATLVWAIAVAIDAMPQDWRRGPIAGEMLIGAVIAAATGAASLGAAAGVIRAASPLWHADLGPKWSETAGQYAPYGWQAPIALLLVAAAAVIVVPRPMGDDIAAVTIGLAAMGAPVGFDLPWWSPMLIGLLATIGLGVAAAMSDLPRVAYTRIVTAGVVALYTAVASLVRAPATAAALESLALAGALVAGLAGVRIAAARNPEDRLARAHLVPVGGGASAAALLALAGSAAALAAGEQHPPSIILAGALAATGLGLAVAGLACWRMPSFLPYVTGAVAAAGSVIALAALPTRQPVAMYAAAAALLGVLAELLRVNSVRRVGWRPEDGWQPTAGWSPRAGGVPVGAWRPAGQNRFGAGAAAASIVPAVIAVVALARPLAAALFGPYHFARHPWTFTATQAGSLYPFDAWRAHGADVLAAAALTFAGGLAAVGLGGSRQLIANRAVAVVVPGAGLTMLLIPAAVGQGQLQATFALLVTTLCGLSLALTPPPSPDNFEAAPLRIARRLVFVLAVLAALAGQTGSLAMRSMTIEALAGSVIVGLIGAIWGRYRLARLIGWNVAGGAAILLALAASLAAGAPAHWSAFPVLAVCAALVAVAALVPRWLRRESIEDEIMVIEATAYLGMGLGLGLTFGAPTYTALAGTALGAILGLAASRPGRPDRYRQVLLIAAAASEVVAVWVLMRQGNVAAPEAYSLPFAVFALFVGVLELRRHPEMRSWVAYGPALVAGFLPSLVLVLVTDTTPIRRVLVILAGALTVAVGSLGRQQAPVVVGTVVTAAATLHEVFRLGAMLPWGVLLALFTATGVLLVALGASYEKRRRNVAKFRSALKGMR